MKYCEKVVKGVEKVVKGVEKIHVIDAEKKENLKK